MSILHTPETAGAKAVYTSDDGKWDHFERNVIGWDKQGRPLVMCGDRLEPADGAPFAHNKEFLGIERPDFVAIFREAVWDSLAGFRDRLSYIDVEQVIRDVVEP
jgi:hypothetical protein